MRVDVIRGREMGLWRRGLQRWAMVGGHPGCPQGQCALQDRVQGVGGRRSLGWVQGGDFPSRLHGTGVRGQRRGQGCRD